MRQVALFLVAISLLVIPLSAGTPGDGSRVPGAADECSNSATAPQPCIRFDSPDQTAGTAPARFYLYAASATCPPNAGSPTNPFGACGGVPAKAVIIGVPPVGILGLLYEESNHKDGLQRGGVPDGMILV